MVFDFEDSVEAARKPEARLGVAQAIRSGEAEGAYVRVNAVGSSDIQGDLEALAAMPQLGGIMLPKVETADELLWIDARLSELEATQGLAPGKFGVLPLIETARGVENLSSVLRDTPRVKQISFGAGDYTLDIGATLTPDETAIAYIRARVVNASRAYGHQAPIDSVWLNVSDDAGLRESCTRARILGFAGKLCIHPRQVGIVNEAFSPSSDDIARAQLYVDEFDAATAKGLAAIHVDGVLVDYPIAARARKTLQDVDVSRA